MHRFWITVTRGGYAERRDLFASRRPDLVGQGRRTAPAKRGKRIGFFRDLLEQDVKHGLDPMGAVGGGRGPAFPACAMAAPTYATSISA